MTGRLNMRSLQEKINDLAMKSQALQKELAQIEAEHKVALPGTDGK